MKPEGIRFSLQRPPQHSDPAMTPTTTEEMTSSQDVTLNHKLRKPLVEKLRRERINTCIEQLKSLLSPKFLKQQPDSKLEKADILEMTVCFLTQLQQQRNLLTHSKKMPFPSEKKLMEADISIPSSKDQTITQCSLETKDNSVLWRPW